MHSKMIDDDDDDNDDDYYDKDDNDENNADKAGTTFFAELESSNAVCSIIIITKCFLHTVEMLYKNIGI